MKNLFKFSSVALAAAIAIAAPFHSASAQQLVGTVANGQIYEVQPAPLSFQTNAVGTYKVNGPMAVRNDINDNAPITIPSRYYPAAGTCRMWYPDRAATSQPAASACDAVIPRGAILIIG